jgi:bifunctional non-homologous end joining protein LigD
MGPRDQHDGYRIIVRKLGDRVRPFTSRGYDWTDRYPLIGAAAASLPATSAVIDGEGVYCDDAGLADFEKLHSRVHDDRVLLYAFDLLELDGVDHRPLLLEARKAARAKLLKKVAGGIHLVEHMAGDGATIFAHACKLGFEGIVSKHREHPYRSGPSKAWVKVKNPVAPGVVRFEDRS